MNSRNADQRRACATLLFAFCLLPFATAQPTRLAVEAATHYGAIWRHTPKLTIGTDQPIVIEELGLRWQTRGRYAWHQWQRFPVLGAALVHIRLGADAHGEAYALLPNLRVPLLRAGRYSAYFRLGTGLAWVTHPYDAFDNPGQNAIGSHWNNMTQFRLDHEVRLTDHWRAYAGAALNHISNGAAALPNFGLNMPTGFVGLAWSPRPIREADFVRSDAPRRSGRRFGGLVQGGLAVVEYAVIDGPRYPIWSALAAGFFYFNRVNRALLGLDYEYNGAIYWWGLHSGEFETAADSRRGATRLSVFVGHEFLFGDFGVQLQLGGYVGGRLNWFTPKKYYSKLTTRYYFPGLFHTALKPYFGISLKAHADLAEYISGQVGFAF